MNSRIHILFMALWLSATVRLSAQAVRAERRGLYDITTAADSQQIDGFKSVIIYSDELGNEVWVSKEKQCVTYEKVPTPVSEGAASMHVTWDKVTGGCKWIGMGFGWNDWQAKDMTGLLEQAAVRMQVRAVKGSFSNFPVAFAFEDYTGVQSFCGFNLKQASGRFNDQSWTVVEIPLKDFPFIRNGGDLSKVKQFMIQLEGAGDIYLDDIRLVRVGQ